MAPCKEGQVIDAEGYDAVPVEPDKPTASSLDLAHECCYAWAPGVKRNSTGGAAASLGTAFHALASHVINHRLAPSVVIDINGEAKRQNLSEEQTDTLHRMAAGWREWWAASSDADGARAEVAFAYNPTNDTARELPPSELHRDYSQAKPDEFTGTADVVIVRPVAAAIIDWKCGQRRYVTVPKENRQLKLLALAAARAYDVDNVSVTLGFIDSEGGVQVETATFDAFELAAIAGEMCALAAKLAGNPEPQTGPHCTWCPAVASCPKSQLALAEIAPIPPPAPFQVVTDPVAITGPDHATWLLHRWRAVKAAAAVVESALQAYSDAHQGIATGDGATWRRSEVSVERINLDAKAKAALEQVLPNSIQFTTTKKAIRDAARDLKLPLKKTEDEVLALLRPLGAVRSSVTVKYEDK